MTEIFDYIPLSFAFCSLDILWSPLPLRLACLCAMYLFFLVPEGIATDVPGSPRF